MFDCSEFHPLPLKNTQNISSSRPERYFALAASAFVIFLTLACALECVSETGNTGQSPHVFPSLLYAAAVWLWWLPWIALLYFLSKVRPELTGISLVSVFMQIPLGVVITIAHLEVLRWTVRALIHLWPSLWEDGYKTLVFMTPGRASLEFLLYGALWLLCAGLLSQTRAQDERVAGARLKEELAEARLAALQMQVAPHFLLNTLNAITGLVETHRHGEALGMLSNLNAMLRTTLMSNPQAKVTVAEEVRTIQSYLAIEQARFADRLTIETRVAADAADGVIPSFLLQPVVENAIRHGIAHIEENGVIHASCDRDGDRLCLRVRDNGPGPRASSNPGYGIGLRNVRERLALFYRDDYSLQMHEVEGGGCEIAITLPFERRLV